jgi:hypothetical protein
LIAFSTTETGTPRLSITPFLMIVPTGCIRSNAWTVYSIPLIVTRPPLAAGHKVVAAFAASGPPSPTPLRAATSAVLIQLHTSRPPFQTAVAVSEYRLFTASLIGSPVLDLTGVASPVP